jgi:hypothetical protein
MKLTYITVIFLFCVRLITGIGDVAQDDFRIDRGKNAENRIENSSFRNKKDSTIASIPNPLINIDSKQLTATSNVPTRDPTKEPTIDPTSDPTKEPTRDPTKEPSADPTKEPSADPTNEPTREPTKEPTADPTRDPTYEPTGLPTAIPTIAPALSLAPSIVPTITPTSTNPPTLKPTLRPSSRPSRRPTSKPSPKPTAVPSANPTPPPTDAAGTASDGSSNSSGETAGIVVGVVFAGIIGAGILFLYYRNAKSKPLRERPIGGYSSDYYDGLADKSVDRSQSSSFGSTSSATSMNNPYYRSSGFGVEMRNQEFQGKAEKTEVKIQPFKKSTPTASLLRNEGDSDDFDPFETTTASSRPPSTPGGPPPPVPRLPPPGSKTTQSNDFDIFN